MIAFDKGVYAQAIEKIFEKYKASALGIDVVFANPSVLGKEDEQKLADVFTKYKQHVVIATRSDYKPHPLCLYNGIQHGTIDTIKQDRLRKFQVEKSPYDLSNHCQENNIYEKNIGSISTLSREVLEIYQQQVSPFMKEKIEKNL